MKEITLFITKPTDICFLEVLSIKADYDTYGDNHCHSVDSDLITCGLSKAQQKCIIKKKHKKLLI